MYKLATYFDCTEDAGVDESLVTPVSFILHYGFTKNSYSLMTPDGKYAVPFARNGLGYKLDNAVGRDIGSISQLYAYRCTWTDEVFFSHQLLSSTECLVSCGDVPSVYMECREILGSSGLYSYLLHNVRELRVRRIYIRISRMNFLYALFDYYDVDSIVGYQDFVSSVGSRATLQMFIDKKSETIFLTKMGNALAERELGKSKYEPLELFIPFDEYEIRSAVFIEAALKWEAGKFPSLYKAIEDDMRTHSARYSVR